MSNLLELSRSVEPLTLFLDSGLDSFPTSVIDVITDSTEVVIERASNEEMNTKLLSLKKGIVTGQPSGIKVRFLLEGIYATEHKGEKVLVAPLPKEHYRMQRRQFFRINTQLSNPVQVTLILPTEEEATFTVGNISSGGLRIDDGENILLCEAGQMFSDCTIKVPNIEPFSIDLEVHNSYEKTKRKGPSKHYVGCEFKNLRANHEHDIQNYINSLQLAQHALSK